MVQPCTPFFSGFGVDAVNHQRAWCRGITHVITRPCVAVPVMLRPEVPLPDIGRAGYVPGLEL